MDPEVLAIIGANRVIEGRAGSPYEAAAALIEPDSPITKRELAEAILARVVEVEQRQSKPVAQADAALRGIVAHASDLVSSGQCASVDDSVRATLQSVWGRNAAARWEGISGVPIDASAIGALVVASLAV